MFRSIGTILLIWFLYQIFSSSFTALDDALTATFHFVEVAAEASAHQFESR